MSADRRTVVIGAGNPFRRDDGVGPAVADAVRALVDDSVQVLHLDGEAARLLDAWDGTALAVVVDAVRTGTDAPGTVGRLGTDLSAARQASSHGLGVEHAMALGRALGRLPDRLVVVGVEIADLADGPGLSPAVAAAVGPAARLVADVVAEGTADAAAEVVEERAPCA